MLELGITQSFQPSLPTQDELESNPESNFDSNFDTENQTLTFPSQVSAIAKTLGVSDTTINNWCAALAAKGYQCKRQGKITEQGYQSLSDLTQAKANGMGLTQYIDTLQTQIVHVSQGCMEVAAIIPVDPDSAIQVIDAELEAVNKELSGIDNAVNSLFDSSNKFAELMLKRSTLNGAKLGVNCAKAELSALQKARNQMLEQAMGEQ